MVIINANNITKSYGKCKALQGLSFEVAKGEIFGIIGPDGAGKTTLFRILATLLLADTGTVELDGLDVVKDFKAIRQRIGYMPGKFSLYQDMSVEENLRFFATIFDTTIEENYELIKDIYSRLEPFKHRRAGKLSGGMKQKLALCCALIHAPHLLLLDEPTTGVDPVSRREFWDMLQRLKNQHGVTIIVSTPYMDEASLCDRIALIQNGKFLQTDTPENIVKAYNSQLWAVSSERMHQLLDNLRKCPLVTSVFSFGSALHVVPQNEVTICQLEEYLNATGHTDAIIEPIRPSVEDCFMSLLRKNNE